MPFLKFTVDSHLLEELGERLVGKPYIALAELVKNSYDADATEVAINLDPKANMIEVSDNGQGMSFEEFEKFWMRVGSRHKAKQKFSKSLRNFHRPLTGSKGIGRLAVQYLARDMTLSTISERDRRTVLNAEVRWADAVKAGELTEAKVEYHLKKVDNGSSGTAITLIGLNHNWSQEAVQGLAREIWWLRPPFRRQSLFPKTARDFTVTFVSPDPEFAEIFGRQMDAILDAWYAKLVGKNAGGKVTLSLEFRDEEPMHEDFDIPIPCKLASGDFEIRIYKLSGRQQYGIKVGDAKDYLKQFGGVRVYDNGFNLPYYGSPENDWLRVELDHSHRLSRSALLPEKYQVEEGMNFLPTLSRVLGLVNVDTSKEKELKIAITRDRLQDSIAFVNLTKMVRWALDFYAVNEKLRSKDEALEEQEIETVKFRNLEDVLDAHASEIPPKTFSTLKSELRSVSRAVATEAEETANRVGFIAPLATAGIASIGFQHEFKQQILGFAQIVGKIDKLRAELNDPRMVAALEDLKEDLLAWINRAEMTNAIFAYYGEAENVQLRERYQATKVVKEIWKQLEFMARGAEIDAARLSEGVLLPKGSLVEWSSIFQNVFLNSFNAMENSKRRLIDISSRQAGRDFEILVQDTGVGIDLSDLGKLFQPFYRKVTVSRERRVAGYGGTGLGLTIVRMVAQNLGVEVTFIPPPVQGFHTAFSLRWREQE